jgi:PAS domain S-box-containing protein
MDIFSTITPGIYWLLVILWAFIFIFYLNKLIRTKNMDQLLKLLLIILAIDAFRTLFESTFFGFWYTSLEGLIPIEINDFLTQPRIVFAPKIINLLTAVLILFFLIRKWIPAEISRSLKMKQVIEDKTNKLETINKELKESETKFKTVFESSNIGKSITQISGEISVNKAFANMIGYTIDELKNKNWQEITPEEEIEAIQNILAPLIKGEEKSARFEKRFIHKEGHHIW